MQESKSIEDIKSYLASDWLAVQDGIRAYLGTDIALLNATNDSLLSSGGKQLRPMLTILMARACSAAVSSGNAGSGANEDSVRFAVAAELLHNATLLHDDVADQSDERRGKPTLRSLMGPSVSVLVGDFWLVRAVKAILDADTHGNRVVALFARTLADLAEGEMLQLQKASSCDTDMDDYLSIIYRKTATLFATACHAAAISVNASEQLENAAFEFGKNLGYAFQMRDDIFDYMPSSGVGKPVGVDVLEGKITLPLLGALANVDAAAQEAIRAKVKNITPASRDEIVDFVRGNGGLEHAQAVLEEYIAKAVDALAVLPESREKDILCQLARYTAIRNK